MRFQASALKWMRTAFFWVITQRVMVIAYQRFGTTYQSLLEDRTDRLSRTIHKELQLQTE